MTRPAIFLAGCALCVMACGCADSGTAISVIAVVAQLVLFGAVCYVIMSLFAALSIIVAAAEKYLGEDDK